jgi:hypothetical protein
MNCKDLEKIIPELVEGELDERTAGLAEEHIRRCPACAAERVAYEEALGALAQPRAMIEVPSELDTFELPEPRRQSWTWLRPAMATAAMAAIMAGIMLMPRTPQPEVNPTPAKPTVRVAASPSTAKAATHTTKQPYSHAVRSTSRRSNEPAMLASAPTPVAEGRRQSGHLAAGYPVRTWVDKPHDAAEEVVSMGRPVRSVRPPVDTGDTGSSVIVVACDLPDEPVAPSSRPAEPAVLYIESRDESNGQTRVYDYRRDSEGNEGVIELTRNKPPT